MDRKQPTVVDYLRLLAKRKWIVVAVVATSLIGAVAATQLVQPVYEARAQIFVGQQQVTRTDIAQGVQVSQLSQQLLKTYARIIRTRPIAERAVESEELPLAPTTLAEALKADPIAETQLIQLSYRSTDPALAQDAVNAVAGAFVDQVARINVPGAGEPAVNVSVLERALLPTRPVEPQPVRNGLLALVLGLVLGVGFAFLAESLDTSVKDKEDIESLISAPVLASIPKVDGGNGVIADTDLHSIGSEAFRKLRTAIQFLSVENAVESVLVTSATSEEGKSSTALNLAIAYSLAGIPTVLVEADLRRPSLHAVLRTDSEHGLSSVLAAGVSLDQAVLPTTIDRLSFLPSGPLPPNPSELLGSRQMVNLMGDLRRRFSAIVVDSPPLLPVADASVLAARVDGVVLVARARKTHRDRVKEAADLVGKVGGRLLGVVLNFHRLDGEGYGYEYYSYFREHQERGPIDA